MSDKPQSLAELQREYESKFVKALDYAKARLKSELGLAALTVESIVKAGEKSVWKDSHIAPILKSLGLQPIPTAPKTTPKAKTSKKTRKRGPNKPKEEVTSANVLAFIGGGKKRLGELTAHFGKAVKSVLNDLEKQGKVAKEIDKKTGGKPATVYSKA